MGIIKQLHSELINQIAAGEVIESPFSVVKELLENSIDAGATELDIETQAAGIEKITISDNGCGMAVEDMRLAVRRHATSKIRQLTDLEAILSYGFRGEALSSIAAVAKMAMESGCGTDVPAHKFIFVDGQLKKEEQVAPRQGTCIIIRDLFYNAPVRRKFLSSERAENKKIRDRIAGLALSQETIAFRLIQNQKKIFQLPPECKKERIISIFGENIRNHLLPVELAKHGIHASGFISDPDFYKSNRSGQYFFVNGRQIELKYAGQLLKKAYDELLPKNGHPWCFLFFTVPPSFIDVNVHPTKKEIRFLDEQGFISFFLELIHSTLRAATPVEFLELKHRLSRPLPSPPSEISAQPQPKLNLPESPITPLPSDNPLYPLSQSQKSFSLAKAGSGNQMEALTDTARRHQQFLPIRHFGIIFETFILAEAEDGFYIIDQHTAHERIRYEEVLREYQQKTQTGQPLLTPIRLELAHEEAIEVQIHLPHYQKLGLDLDSLGGDTILIREVPVFITPGKEKETILDFLERIHSVEKPELYDIMAKSIACRSAIKKGDSLSDHMLAEIINRLSYCQNPFKCPHGRPTLIKLNRTDLEKMFHRIP